MLRIIRKQRMKRVQPDHVGAVRGSEFHERMQVAEIADPPIIVGPQQIELRGNAPEPPSLRDAGRQPAASGDDDNGAGRTARFKAEPVVAPGDVVAENKASPLQPPAIQIAFGGEIKPGESLSPTALAALF